MSQITLTLGEIAALIGSLTVIGGALMWLYKKVIADPREKRRLKNEDERYKKMLEVATSQDEPLSHAIEQLTEWLDESKDDRKSIHKLLEQQSVLIRQNSDMLSAQDSRLDNHNERILVLEVSGGFRRINSMEVQDAKLDVDE